jgi:phosphatidylserine decarboxylase
MRNNLYPVANNGLKYLAYAFVAFVLFYILACGFLTFISFVAMLTLVFIYRNPERIITNFDEKSVTSPVDGIVKSIENIDDKEYGYKVTIKSSYYDVGLLRVPFNATVKLLEMQRGTSLCSNSLLYEKLNENITVIFENQTSDKMKVNHKLNRSIDKINIDLIESQRVLKALRYGFLVNGTTTLYLPRSFRFNINVGNKLCGAESLIGYFS